MPRENAHAAAPERSIDDRGYLADVCERRDEEVFFRLVESLHSEVGAYIRRYVGNDTDAQDILQLTGVKALDAFRRGLFDASKALKPWYYTIATRTAIDWQRREKKHASVLRLDAVSTVGEDGHEGKLLDLLARDDDASEGVALAEECQRVRECVQRLSPDLRDAVTGVYFDGLKYRVVAEDVGAPVGTVKSRLHASLRKLREMMDGAKAA